MVLALGQGHAVARFLVEFTRQTLEQRRPALEPAQKAVEMAADMGEKLTSAKLTRSEALRDLASVTEKLSQQAKELGQNPALKPLERAAREPGAGTQSAEELQQQMQAMQKALGNAAANGDKLDQLAPAPTTDSAGSAPDSRPAPM